MASQVLFAVAVLAVGVPLLGDAAWTWPQDGNSAARDGKALVQPARGSGRPRYDIYEPDVDDFTLPSDLSGLARPPGFGAPGSAALIRPGGYAPGSGYGQGAGFAQGGPGGPVGPGGYRPGGVGGPVGPHGSSGVTKCKCSYPINCGAPSLQFGSCDAGKRYCCTKVARGLPSGRPVLAGPDGPLGILKQGYGANGPQGASGGLYGPGGAYGGAGSSQGGYGAGARGDVLYGPRPGGFDGSADFRPGPDFNRRPGTSARPGNYNIHGLDTAPLYFGDYNADYNADRFGSQPFDDFHRPLGYSGHSYRPRPAEGYGLTTIS